MKGPSSALLRHLWREGRLEIGRRLRRPVEERFQPYAYTLPDRYPWLFDFAAQRLDGIVSPRLLSFGCSRGDEVLSLARRLPRAAIKGIDIDPKNIAACRSRWPPSQDRRIVFEVASNTRKEPSGYYDAIFCLAVLCHGDLTVKRARRSEPLMRFSDFEQTVVDLARRLRPGGFLFLHTTNFRLCDTILQDRFEVVLEARPEDMAQDVLFDREGRLMPGARYYPVGFRKRAG